MESSLVRSEEHTSELQSPCNLVCRLLLEKKVDDAPALRDVGGPWSGAALQVLPRRRSVARRKAVQSRRASANGAASRSFRFFVLLRGSAPASPPFPFTRLPQ